MLVTKDPVTMVPLLMVVNVMVLIILHSCLDAELMGNVATLN